MLTILRSTLNNTTLQSTINNITEYLLQFYRVLLTITAPLFYRVQSTLNNTYNTTEYPLTITILQSTLNNYYRVPLNNTTEYP